MNRVEPRSRNISTELAGETLNAYFVHPPYRNGAGYTYWTHEADVRDDSELQFCIGMGDRSPLRSDGVWFKVYVAIETNGGVDDYVKIFEASTKLSQWLPKKVDLQRFSGKRVRFKFIADCGPSNNTNTDQAYWGEPRVVSSGTPDDKITRSTESMTWVNAQSFRSGFYFHRVNSKHVDLTFSVETSAPVVVESIAAHGHPDAIYRVFEGGIVLANPSREPYTFDLSTIAPGRKYRRIQATANQDIEANNGQPVADRVTLGDRDAIFLIRTPDAASSSK
jgi:hypothetical protein